jgi:Cdc6-like AAA superfamily ATPase
MTQAPNVQMTVAEATNVALRVSNVFQPRTPITTRALFAGRWPEMTTLADAVGQIGLHVIIYGERGVGKTSLANVVRPVIHVLLDKGSREERVVLQTTAAASDTFSTIWDRLFRDIVWQDERPAFGLSRKPSGDATTIREAFGLPEQLAADDVRHVLSFMKRSVFIIDEFDRAANATSKEFTDLIKALSDRGIDATVILVGVSDTVDELIADHASIHRALIQIPLPRMQPKELAQILGNAEKELGIGFSEAAANLIVRMSQGLPHYTHLLGQHSVREAANSRRSPRIELPDVFAGLKAAVKHAQQTVTGKHSTAIHSAHKDALYRQVLLACALTASQTEDPLGYFNPGAIAEPLSIVLDKSVQIATFSNHLAEFSQPKRGQVLERTGQARAYRFRFRDPLLVPYIFMDAVTNGIISDAQLAKMIGGGF